VGGPRGKMTKTERVDDAGGTHPSERQKRAGRAERHGIPLPNHEPQQKKKLSS